MTKNNITRPNRIILTCAFVGVFFLGNITCRPIDRLLHPLVCYVQKQPRCMTVKKVPPIQHELPGWKANG